ncbi:MULTISPECIES: tyrosine-type recombinase/integrase [Pseudomonas]|uniref:tyrosine-type recombinase/integrase n=1 Tax=Pseudomonas TaxID=286 RepID=UPI000272BF59|nr:MULTISPECIES: tyrosine-type recombinase/integrase [Pseudomonas]EJF68993.1 hypothetical protein A462_26574 [Pseudomonas sp. Ag1]
MRASLPLLHPVTPLVKLNNLLSYQEYGCQQLRSPTPDSLKCSGMQRFGVVYEHALELAAVMSTLQSAHAEGALNGVVLLDMQDNLLLIITDSEVASSDIPALERSWASALKESGLPSWTVSFANQNELLGAESEIDSWMVAKTILSCASFGVNQRDFRTLSSNFKEQLTFSTFTDGVFSCSPPSEPIGISRAFHTECQPCSDAYLTNINSGSEKTMTLPSIFSHQELNDIGEAILQKHNLRDQCLFGLLLAQYRPIELQMMRASQVTDMHSGVHIRMQKTRLSGHFKELVLSPRVGAMLIRYIESNGLSGDDFLFPSRSDSKTPMNSGALVKSFRSWLRDANVDPALRSISSIRHSVSTNNNLELPSLNVRSLVHSSLSMTAYYISANRKNTERE